MSKTEIRRRVARAAVELVERRLLLSSVVVNSVIDAVYAPNSGMVSLRNAVADANGSSTPTTISFDPTVFASAQRIQLNGTALELTNNGNQLTMITGPAAGLTLDAGNMSAAFTVDGGATASISGITFTNGSSGALNNGGTLTLTNSSITNSHNAPSGGGISNGGTLTLINDTVSGNTAYYGGGILNSATLIVTDSTFSNDTSTGEPQYYGNCGAAIYTGGTATIDDSTFAENTGSQGIAVYGSNISLSEDTIADNTGGSAIYSVGNAAFNVSNCIVAGNVDTRSGLGDAEGPFNSLGFNVVGETDGSTGWNADDHTGTIANPLNAVLGTLAANGGPTQTILPLEGSPAIDAGSTTFNPSGITTDQRGEPRMVNNTLDIGSVETQKSISFTGPGSQAATVGVQSTFNIGSFTESGTASPFAIDINWGDGSAHTMLSVTSSGVIAAQTHTFASVATDTVTVKVTDASGLFSSSGTFTVTATAQPAITITPPAAQTALIGIAKTFSLGSFTETNLSGPFTIGVNWGSGTTQTTFTANTAGTIAAQSHTYRSGGEQTVEITISDRYGTVTSSASFNIAVSIGTTPSTTTLQTTGSTFAFASPISLTATIAPTTATGVVNFYRDGTVVGQGTLAGGTATFSSSSFPVGSYQLTAVYGGDSTYASSTSAAISITVTAPPNTTTLSLVSSTTTATTSQAVTFTATINSTTADSATATGTVTFYYNASTVLEVVPLPAGGVATFTNTTSLPMASDSISASYSGDSNFSSSDSAPVTVQVSQGTTATVLTISSSSKTSAQAITLSALVKPSSATGGGLTSNVSTGGVVSFYENGVPIGDANLGSVGVATLVASTEFPVGLNLITANFQGTASFGSSTSETADLAVTAHALVPTNVKVNVPATVIGTAPIHGAVTAKLTNGLSGTETGTESGTFSAQIFAAADTTFDAGSDTVVATLKKSANVKEGKSIAVKVPITVFPASLATGDYHLFLVTTDSRGNEEVVDTGAMVNVTSPTIVLAAQFVSVARNGFTGVVAINNAGNVNDVSTFTAVIGLATDSSGQNSVSTGSGVVRPVKITVHPGKSTKINLSGWKSLFSSLPTGSYYLTVTVTDSMGNTASAVSAIAV